VLRALEQEPQRRYQQASEVKTDVETISRSPQPGRVGQVFAAHQGAAQDSAEGKMVGREDLAHPTTVAAHPHFSGFAILGAVWALFGLLTVVPVLYFIGLNRVWNGTAQPTDVIYAEPPLAFTVFMGALLAIGAGAPIGTTILGALAITHIKRTGGRIYGLPLAVADAIFFPLLLVFAAIAAGLGLALWVLFPFVAMPPDSEGPARFGFTGPKGTVVGSLVALPVCFLVGRALWRAIVHGARVPGVEPSSFQRAGVADPETAKDATTGPHLVQAPADCLLLAAGVAFVTACGVALWLMAAPTSSLTTSLIRGNLTITSIVLAIYSLLIGVAGLMLRRLRARIFVLLVAVIAGLFLPAVIALNVAMEFRGTHEWLAAMPLWLGMPAALWVVITLFRDDVRRAFSRAAEVESASNSPAGSWLFSGTGAVLGVLSLFVPLALLLGVPALRHRINSSRVATAQLTFTVVGPHVDVSLNGQKVPIAADGRATMRLRPGDYETTFLKGNILQYRVYEFFYAGEVKHAAANNFDTIWIKGPLTLEFEPSSGNPAVPDYAAMQGRWNIVSQVKDGGFLLESQRSKWLECDKDIMRGDLPDQPHTQPFFTESRFALNSDTSPRQFDYPDLGAKGIYRLHGDTLTLAVADAGQPRPTEFRSVAGSKVMLTICRRATASATTSGWLSRWHTWRASRRDTDVNAGAAR
jgi:uncharacterized protein (TIGR03067 family)